MTTLEVKLNLPDRLAREAQAAGLLTPEALAQHARDPDDDAVLACALAAHAQLIVSGHRDLLSLGSFQGMPIVKPAEAVRIIEK